MVGLRRLPSSGVSHLSKKAWSAPACPLPPRVPQLSPIQATACHPPRLPIVQTPPFWTLSASLPSRCSPSQLLVFLDRASPMHSPLAALPLRLLLQTTCSFTHSSQEGGRCLAAGERGGVRGEVERGGSPGVLTLRGERRGMRPICWCERGLLGVKPGGGRTKERCRERRGVSARRWFELLLSQGVSGLVWHREVRWIREGDLRTGTRS